MKKRRHLFPFVLTGAVALFLISCQQDKPEKIRPGHPEWPMVWTSYRVVESPEEDIADLKEHGVGLITSRANNVQEAKKALEIARETGMKYHISFPDITEHKDLVESAGLEPLPASMIGGVYRGKAIDRHLFSFSPSKHTILIEPPVYDMDFPYTRGSGGTGRPRDTEKIGHYFPDMGDPVKAEIVVPLKAFDGEQHLKIIPAEISVAPEGAKPENDSYQPGMPESSEITNRKLYHIDFDLGGLEDAMLDKVGIAVYWEYDGTDQYWIFGRGNVSAWASSTEEALRHQVRKELEPWVEANGGEFPHETVIAARYGDECFYISGHYNGLAVNYPLWDYSRSAVEAYRSHAGNLEYPRTWGFPEIYGRDAYSWWMYTLHEGCANMCEIAGEEAHKIAPNLMLFRNQTRMGVFGMENDRDGSGQELMSQTMEIVHLDPYPVGGSGYRNNIPRDMSYCGGLARRYDKLLIPWMQAHTYGGPDGLQHVTPKDVGRMTNEQWAQGVDAIMWLGYGQTFPEVRPDSWERAAKFHHKLIESAPPKPEPRMAVLRSYDTWALANLWEGKIRNPGDWYLQQLLEVWSVEYRKAYDVFEIPPEISPEELEKLKSQLEDYSYVVSTMPMEGAWVVGQDMEGQAVDTDRAAEIQKDFEQQLKAKGWL